MTSLFFECRSINGKDWLEFYLDAKGCLSIEVDELNGERVSTWLSAETVDSLLTWLKKRKELST